MFISRAAFVVRAAVIGVLVGTGSVLVLSACQPVARSAPSSDTATASGLYGDPAAANIYWQPQTRKDDCALLAVADVVGELTGQEPTEQQMLTLAEGTPSEIRPGPIYVADPADPGDPGHLGHYLSSTVRSRYPMLAASWCATASNARSVSSSGWGSWQCGWAASFAATSSAARLI